jgi:hypothetical protein
MNTHVERIFVWLSVVCGALTLVNVAHLVLEVAR